MTQTTVTHLIEHARHINPALIAALPDSIYLRQYRRILQARIFSRSRSVFVPVEQIKLIPLLLLFRCRLLRPGQRKLGADVAAVVAASATVRPAKVATAAALSVLP